MLDVRRRELIAALGGAAAMWPLAAPRRKTEQSSSPASRQVRDDYQPQDCENAEFGSASDATRHCRRGDRMSNHRQFITRRGGVYCEA
jgi:hypothetical protein